ncbi:MAG: alkaline phosphatase D family protein [Bdellovibrionota bacterium]
MQNGFAILLLILTTSVFAQTNHERLEALKTTNINRIAFGSCNNQNHAQPLWKDLMITKPDLWIWGGDIIYADWERNYNIKASYDKQKSKPDYQEFIKQTPVIGMWDDHDYAGNNADGRNSVKQENQKLLLDFLDEPEDSPRRTQEGIYTSYEFGEEGKRIKVILLDGRYFKNLEADAPVLGNKQWEWFENEIKHSTAQVHLIMTGLSIFSPLLPYSEEWWHWPGEVKRLQKIMEDHKPQGTVFLTGDKHFASIFRSYGQLEFLSSGMTHVIDRRVWWYLGRKFPTTYFGINYGMIDIEWEGSVPLITLGIRTPSHRSVHQQKYKWGNGKWDRQWQLWEVGREETEVEDIESTDLPLPLQVMPEDMH